MVPCDLPRFSVLALTCALVTTVCGACSSPTSSSAAPIAVSTTTIAFPATAVGATAASSSVTVSTASAATIGVSVNDPVDFQFSTTCTVSLPAGASCPVTVQFHPVVPGALTGWLTIDSTTGKAVVALSGTAIGDPQGNAGSPVSLLQIVTAQPNPFYLVPGQTSQLGASATFADGGGQDVTAVAAWTSSDPGVARVSPAGLITAISGGTAGITVGYQGHNASIRVLVVGAFAIAPGSFAFPPTTVGQQSPVQMFTVTLGGPNVIGSISSSNPAEFTVLSSTCDTTSAHAAGYTCSVGIQFSPIATGPRTAQIAVSSAAPAIGPTGTLTVSGAGQ